MYAIIEDRGKQYRVEEGAKVRVDLSDAAPGSEVTFDKVLFASNGEKALVGTPAVEGASVKARVLGMEKGPKLTVQYFRRRKDSRSKTGHRQKYTEVMITSLDVALEKKKAAAKPKAEPVAEVEPEEKPKAEAEAPAKKASPKRKAAKKAAPKKPAAKKPAAKKTKKTKKTKE